MPVNPIPPETRGQTASKFVARHSEAVCLSIGFLLGVLATLLGVVVG
jgi:hypothetical protein